MSVPAVLAELRAAESSCGRPAGSVRLLAVTKGRSAEQVRERVLPYRLPLGENRSRELEEKQAALPGQEWHFLGTLQLSSLRHLLGVTMIHSVTSAGQLEFLARRAGESSPQLLLQVHNGEPQKQGADPDQLPALARLAAQLQLPLQGLMVMAPAGDLAAARRVFARTRQQALDLGLGVLSMGMSDDFVVAVEEGSTLVRIGRRLFE